MFTFRGLAPLILASASWTNTAAAAAVNAFFNPAPLTSSNARAASAVAYGAGQVLNITWTTTYRSVDLLLWQEAVDGSFNRLFQGRTSGSSYLWPINVDTFNTDGVNATTGVPNYVFNLVMYETGNADGTLAFSSQWFNVTSADAASGSATPTTTYASVMAATSTAGLPTSVTSNAQAYGDSSSSNARQLNLGLGIGLGIGIPFLGLVACLAYSWDRKRTRQDVAAMQQSQQAGPNGGQMYPQPGIVQQPQPQPAWVEHYGPQDSQEIQYSPPQSQMQPIVTAKYQ